MITFFGDDRPITSNILLLKHTYYHCYEYSSNSLLAHGIETVSRAAPFFSLPLACMINSIDPV